MTDLDQTTCMLAPVDRRSRCSRWPHSAIVGGPKGIGGKQVLGVHQDQLLMLLLMVQAKLDERGTIGRILIEELSHRLRDMEAIGGDLLDTGTRDQPALWARMARPDRLVVGIEEIFIGGVEDAIRRHVRPQDESFEEPRRVCEM